MANLFKEEFETEAINTGANPLRQNTGFNFDKTSAALILTYSSLQRNLTAHFPLLCIGNLPTLTSTFTGTASTNFLQVKCVQYPKTQS